MQYIRQWKVGDETFDSKTAAQQYEARMALSSYGITDVGKVIGHADEVIALLKPFATPRTRKPKSNGTSKRPGKAAQAHTTA